MCRYQHFKKTSQTEPLSFFDKGESQACQITSSFHKKIGCFCKAIFLILFLKTTQLNVVWESYLASQWLLSAQVLFNGAIPTSFCFYFCPFLITISIIQIVKSVDGLLGFQTRGRRMVVADDTTELWQPPLGRNLLVSVSSTPSTKEALNLIYIWPFSLWRIS